MDNVISYVTEKQRNLLGSKIALLIAKFVGENFEDAVIQVFGDNHEYRAKLNIRYNKRRISIKMRKGLITVEHIGFVQPSGTAALQVLSDKKWEIPLADPKSFEKTAEHTKELLCNS